MAEDFFDVFKRPGELKGPGDLGNRVKVVAILGAEAWDKKFRRYDYLKNGTVLEFTGKTIRTEGHEVCEVIPIVEPYWVKANNGMVQILDNPE